MTGIYRLDFSSGHFYIGQSTHLTQRWRLHRSGYKHTSMQKHHPKLFNVWAKYGEPTFTVLVYCEQDELTHIEQGLIDYYWGNPLLANTNPDATTSRGVKRNHTPWQLGKKFTAEHRQRLSDAKQNVSGIQNNNHKLTEDHVRDIRRRYKKQVKGCGSTTLAKEFGVSHNTILMVVNGERYANVSEI